MSEEKLTRAAVVTGGSRGIGAATARRFAAGGCKVVINYHRSQAQAEALAAEPGLTVEQVILTESGGGRAQVTVGLTWQGEALSVTVEVS